MPLQIALISEMELGLIFIIFLTGVFSGFVDAIAGGGGLIMGLILSGLPVGAATSGTLGALRFAHTKKVDWRACTYIEPAVFGSLLGSRSIGFCQNLGRTRGDRLDDCHYAFFFSSLSLVWQHSPVQP